jgi:hypothetical protein
VALVRTPQGWSVRAPDRTHPVGDLIEGLSLTDLVAEEYGGRTEPDRSARRSVRGPADATHREDGDPVSARLVALERTVAQLEHALAARVSTERAIGVLAERHGTSPRAAFETMRRDARSQGRAVHELAREVLDGLAADRTGAEAVVDTQTRSPSPGTPAAQRPASPDPSTRSTGALADGGS